MICSIEGCQRQKVSKGLCRKHYTQAWRISKGEALKTQRNEYNREYVRRVKDSPEFRSRRAEYQRYWRERNKEKCRSSDTYGQRYLRRYGLTKESFAAMMERQGGVCAICKQPPQKKRLAVDHDHQTGKVRGLLCDPCNHGLGMFKGSPKLCRRAASYLASSQG